MALPVLVLFVHLYRSEVELRELTEANLSGELRTVQAEIDGLREKLEEAERGKSQAASLRSLLNGCQADLLEERRGREQAAVEFSKESMESM